VTLRELTPKLSKPETFVRAVIGIMHGAAKEHGDIVIRMGTTGTGKLPNYRIEAASTLEPIQAIDGNGHKPWTGAEDFTGPANWSTATMTRTDVEDVLIGITGYKRPATKT